MTRPTKHPRTGMYQVRVWVPIKLRPYLDRRELVQSLGVKDATEAKRLAPPVVSGFRAQIEEARRRAAVGEPPPVSQATGEGRRLKPATTARRVPCEADIRAAVVHWLHNVSRQDLASPIPDDADEALSEIRTDIAVMADPEQGWQQASSTLLTILADHGFAGPPLSLLAFGVEFTRGAISERNRLIEQRLSGTASEVNILNPALADASPLLAPPPRPAQAKEALRTETLLAAWAAETKPSRATQKKYGGAFNRIAGVIGHDDVRRWAAEDVVRFKQARLKDGRDPKTVSDDVLACSAVCKWAMTNRLLDANPFSGLAPKVSRRGEAPRAPYTDDEAQRILSAAREEKGWLRWMPWLLAFTGTRISELADLRRGDVREEAGVMILDIRPTNTREGKNPTMQRMLPLHPAVIAEGFLEYVADLPVDPTAPLFPSIRPDPRGGRAQPATTQMGRWIHGAVGITDPKKGPSHSWRHRMEDELRKVRALPEVQDAITGRYNPRNAGDGYGKGFRGMPDELVKDLGRIPSPCSPAQRATKRQIGDGLAAAPP